ncbi:MAG: deoxyribose-phosphate aldolase [Gammaproteobacteria bacterium]|nr:deoxyribose-phosphate aldolase [Gammaproteobacteria bacterium]
MTDHLAERLIPYIDYTNLDEQATTTDIETLCRQATTPKGNVAAVCVFPRYVAQCHTLLSHTGILIATVVNFPQGTDTLDRSCHLIEKVLLAGANEIDLVMPYSLFLAGKIKTVEDYLVTCEKHVHPQARLKIILETGELKTPLLIQTASQLAIQCGADFLKTSTGKVPIGATLEAASILLHTIQASGAPVGFKASGGIRTPTQAHQYFHLASQYLPTPLTAKQFRLGASQLLRALLTANSP